MLLEILQNSLEKPCARVSFLVKSQASDPFMCFTEHIWTTASVLIFDSFHVNSSFPDCLKTLKTEKSNNENCLNVTVHSLSKHYTAQKMKFSIKDFFSKCDQIRRKLRISSHLLKKSLMENLIFCAVLLTCRIAEFA